MILFLACNEKNPADPKIALSEKFQNALDDARKTYNLIGLSAAVIIPDGEDWAGCSGNSHEDVPLSPDMLFHAGSSGKNYTAALTLALVEENKLKLEDSLYKWLPEYSNVDSNITILQLLNHTSGLYNYTGDQEVWDAVFADPHKVWAPEEIITQFLKEPYFSPGQGWHYSNANYVLLGMIIKQASGSEISDELRRRFFDPFELNNTFFAQEEAIPLDMAHCWYDYNQDGVLDDMSFMPMDSFNSFGWTAGSIIANAEDLAKWAGLLYGGHILSVSSLEIMLTFYPRQDPESTGYGLGTERYELHERILYGHSGGGFYHSVFMYLLESGISIAVLSNQGTSHILDTAGILLDVYLIHHNQAE